VQGSDGSFYGTTSGGGVGGGGTVFRLTIVPQPQLTLIPSGPYVILAWPTNYAGFSYAGYTLQSATNLGSSAIWTTNSSPPVVIGGENVVINPITGTQKFYRLNTTLTNVGAVGKIPFDPAKTYILLAGDSITAGFQNYCWFLTNNFGWSNFVFFTNSAVGGYAITNLVNDWAGGLAHYAPGPGTNALLFIEIGVNDLFLLNPYGYLASLSNYIQTALSVRMTPILFTITPRGDALQSRLVLEENRAIMNDGIRRVMSWAYLIDADALLPDCTDTNNFLDQVHWSQIGHYKIARALDGILRSPSRGSLPVTYHCHIGTNFYGLMHKEILF
jgi:uncharacterized repeat protein (TIGR03803 family)